ncbi:MAG TPA: DnaB-like helicase C-terminal domain-containing protein, partial [Verrucomicrobiae bacterium]|nr:DnaB-like helicase C-terminal domain-containing protein [Verrucomicrobiae bacterium]
LQKPAIPRLAHLRESGSIEQDADVVLFIYRKAADKNYRPEDLSPEEQNLAEIHIAKHRNGPTGMVRLYFDAARASFKNLQKNPMMGMPPPPPMAQMGAPSGGALPPGVANPASGTGVPF